MNGLIRQWGGQVRDNKTVYFAVIFNTVAKVIISRVADSPSDPSNTTNSVQPLPSETGNTIKTGFTPHFGDDTNGGHFIAIGY